MDDLLALIRRTNADSNQYEDSPCNACGTDRHRRAAMYQRDRAAKTAAAAAILQLQKDANDYLKQENETLRKKVKADKKQHSSAAAHEGKTWKTYIP